MSSFLKAGLTLGEAQIGLLVMGAMNVAMTVISTVIVDIAGRKTLLIVGFVLMIIDTVLLCIFLNLAVRNFLTCKIIYVLHIGTWHTIYYYKLPIFITYVIMHAYINCETRFRIWSAKKIKNASRQLELQMFNSRWMNLIENLIDSWIPLTSFTAAW